ncbi:hypothetical protein EJB05_56883, partial [Eragrostis curvula]
MKVFELVKPPQHEPSHRGGYNERWIEVAVKQVRDVKTSLEELHREIQFLATLRHQNLVRFIGYCFRKKSRLFVYEYLPNGDLERFAPE